MKKIYMILAAALVMLAANSCDKANVSQDDLSVEPMVVNFTAKVIDTKTIFNPSSLEDGASVPVLWTGNEGIDIYVNEKALTGLVPEIPVKIEGEAPSATASWSYDFSKTYDGEFSGGFKPAAPFTFYAFCPGKNTRAFYNAGEQRILVDGIPAEQTPGENSCDEAAMMLCSISQEYTLWPDNVEMPDFKHMTAYGCITLGSGAPTEGVKKVSVTANAGQYLAGSAWYYYAGGKEGEWENHSNPGTETITINTESGENIWFGCRPTTALTSLTFEVVTEAGETYKVVKDLTDKNLKFTAGKVALMTIDGFEELTEVTYSWAANDLASLIGGDYTEGDLTKTNVINNSTPSLNISTISTLAAGVTSVSVKTANGRLKFGGLPNVMDDFKMTITPETGWMVKNVVINAARATKCGEYSILAKVGETTLLNETISTSDEDYTGIENANEGPLMVTVSKNDGENSGVFYLSNVSLTLKRIDTESDIEN